MVEAVAEAGLKQEKLVFCCEDIPLHSIAWIVSIDIEIGSYSINDAFKVSFQTYSTMAQYI